MRELAPEDAAYWDNLVEDDPSPEDVLNLKPAYIEPLTRRADHEEVVHGYRSYNLRSSAYCAVREAS